MHSTRLTRFTRKSPPPVKRNYCHLSKISSKPDWMKKIIYFTRTRAPPPQAFLPRKEKRNCLRLNLYSIKYVKTTRRQEMRMGWKKWGAILKKKKRRMWWKWKKSRRKIIWKKPNRATSLSISPSLTRFKIHQSPKKRHSPPPPHPLPPPKESNKLLPMPLLLVTIKYKSSMKYSSIVYQNWKAIK